MPVINNPYDKGNSQYNPLQDFGFWENKFKGGNFDILQGILKDRLSGVNPAVDQLFSNAQRKIGKSTDRNIRAIKEQNAQSGFRGIGANQINQAYATEKDAIGGLEDAKLQAQLGVQQNAINNLLGLNQFESQVGQNTFQSLFNTHFKQQELNLAKDQSETDFMDVLGSILGMGAGALGGGYLGTLGSKWA